MCVHSPFFTWQKSFWTWKKNFFLFPFNSKYFHKRLCSEFCDENDDAVIVCCRNEVKDFPGIFLSSLFLYLLYMLYQKKKLTCNSSSCRNCFKILPHVRVLKIQQFSFLLFYMKEKSIGKQIERNELKDVTRFKRICIHKERVMDWNWNWVEWLC